MRKTISTLATLVLLASVGTAEASERADLFPGQEKWHRYSFVVVPTPGNVTVTQSITLLWDNPPAAVVISVLDLSNATTPIMGISVGNDRMASLGLGLFPGSYELGAAPARRPATSPLSERVGARAVGFSCRRRTVLGPDLIRGASVQTGTTSREGVERTLGRSGREGREGTRVTRTVTWSGGCRLVVAGKSPGTPRTIAGDRFPSLHVSWQSSAGERAALCSSCCGCTEPGI